MTLSFLLARASSRSSILLDYRSSSALLITIYRVGQQTLALISTVSRLFFVLHHSELLVILIYFYASDPNRVDAQNQHKSRQ
jgi:hypothetical protein